MAGLRQECIFGGLALVSTDAAQKDISFEMTIARIHVDAFIGRLFLEHIPQKKTKQAESSKIIQL